MTTEFFIRDKFIYGPVGDPRSGKYWIRKGFIYGPGDDPDSGMFWIDSNGFINGPSTRLPFF